MAICLTKLQMHKILFRTFLPAIIPTFFFLTPAQAGQYVDSAHGSSASGVKRSDTALAGYSKGNCSHCHEQHASIDGAEPSPASGSDSASPFAVFADFFNTSTTITPYL